MKKIECRPWRGIMGIVFVFIFCLLSVIKAGVDFPLSVLLVVAPVLIIFISNIRYHNIFSYNDKQLTITNRFRRKYKIDIDLRDVESIGETDVVYLGAGIKIILKNGETFVFFYNSDFKKINEMIVELNKHIE